MVDRVFCYSDQEARKNGNSVSIGKMLLQLILIIVFFIFICSMVSSKIMFRPEYFTIFVGTFTIAIMVFAINFSNKFRSRLIGFAKDENNNVYCVNKLNNGEEFAIGGLATGRLIKLLDENNSVTGDAVQALGAAISMYKINNSTKIMQNPEIIAKMVEYATTTTGAEVKQILKVYNYTQDSHKVKIRCDYKLMRNGKIKYNKNITIYKSFNCFNDLMNVILDKRRS